MILWRRLAFSQCLLDDYVNSSAILGVHADHATAFRRSSHGAEDTGIIQHENSRICHEEFETRDTIADKLRHLVQASIGQIGDDAMECVVAHCLGLCLLHPGVEGGAQRLAFVLDGEIDQRCCAAKCRGPRASLKVVGARGATEWHVEMSMDVDATGHDVLS